MTADFRRRQKSSKKLHRQATHCHLKTTVNYSTSPHASVFRGRHSVKRPWGHPAPSASWTDLNLLHKHCLIILWILQLQIISMHHFWTVVFFTLLFSVHLREFVVFTAHFDTLTVKVFCLREANTRHIAGQHKISLKLCSESEQRQTRVQPSISAFGYFPFHSELHIFGPGRQNICSDESARQENLILALISFFVLFCIVLWCVLLFFLQKNTQ